MSSIAKNNQDNLGGINKLFYALQSEVSALVDPELLQISGATSISLSQAQIDTNFFDIGFLMRSANHDENESNGPAGNSYQHQVECRLSKDRADIRAQQDLTNNRKCVLIFRNNNGDWKLLYGMLQTSQFRSGKQPMDTNGYTLQWEANLPCQALTLNIT